MNYHKIMVLLIVLVIVLSGFSIIMNSTQQTSQKSYTINPLAQTTNTLYINNTFYINDTIKDPLTGNYGMYGFDSNVVIGTTGALIVTNATVYFLEDSLHPITLTVDGSLILNKATLTSVPDRLYPYVNFTLSAYNNALLDFNNSKLIYPGWFNVTNDVNVFASNTIFDKLSDQNLSLLTNYGFTGDINAVNSGPTPYFYYSTVHFTNVSFPHLFEHPAGSIATFAHGVSSTINGTSIPATGLVIKPTNGATIIANKFSSILPNYVSDLTLTNATINIVYNATGYNGTSYITAAINNSQEPVQSYMLPSYPSGSKSTFSASIPFNGVNTIPVSLNFLNKINNLIIKITPPKTGTIKIYSLTLNLSTDTNLLTYGFYKYNFNLIHSILYGKDIFISANYNSNTGNTLYNAIYLNQSSTAYFLNLSVTNTPTKLDPPYVIDSSSNIYIFRYANIKVQNFDGTPISNAIISYNPYEDSQALNSLVNSLDLNIPSYFRYNPSNITNNYGRASIPLLSDIIQLSYWPNSEYLGNYNFTVWTSNYTKVLIRFGASLSYFPYLTVSSNNVNRTVTVTIPNIKGIAIYTNPYFVQYSKYTISATFNITGSSVYNVPVTFFINTPSPTYLYTTVNMIVGEINTANVYWSVPGNVYGNFTITATANPNKSIFETNYTDNSVSSLIEIYPKIDIGVSQIKASSTLLYQNTTLSFNIFNNGWDNANNVLVTEQLYYPNGSSMQKNIVINVPANTTLPETMVFYAGMSGSYTVQIDAHYYWDYNQLNNIANITLVYGLDYYPISFNYSIISNISASNNIMTLNISSIIGLNGANIDNAPPITVEFYDYTNNITIGYSTTSVINGKLVSYLITSYFVYGQNYRVEVIVNPTHTVTETNYNNNYLFYNIRVPAFIVYSIPSRTVIVNGTTDTIFVNTTLMQGPANNVTISLLFIGYPALTFTNYTAIINTGQTYNIMFILNTSKIPDLMNNRTKTTLNYEVLLTYSQLSGYYYIVTTGYITILEKPMLSISYFNVVTNTYVSNISKIAQGLSFDIFVNIYNIGGSTAYGPIFLNITDGSAVLYNSNITTNLVAGGNVSVYINYMASLIGPHTLNAAIVYAGVQKSTIYNTKTLNFIVIPPKIRLIVTSLSTATVVQKQTLSFIVYAVNENASAQKGYTVYTPGVTVYATVAGISQFLTTNNLGYGTFKFVPEKTGTYPLLVKYSYAGVTSSYIQTALITVKSPPLVIPWLLIIIIVIIAAVGAFLGYTYYSYKKVEKNVMVCGNCGAVIKADAEKCPVCGVVFEKDKVKCSECGEWIKVDDKYCPNCGALFIKKEEPEYEHLSAMKQKYDAYVQRFKDEAKRDLGEKYTPEEFTKWWQAKNEYISFETWLKQQEEENKKETIKCPVCGSLNPKTAKVCSVCGASLVAETKEESPPEKPPKTPPSEPAKPSEEKKEEQVVKKRILKRIIPGEEKNK
ncbi:MAG: zinc ribbon domain-containing protein [Thermoplasmata archaeon]